MKRRGFINLFAAASVAVACRITPDPGIPETVALPQEMLDRIYARIIAETKAAWNARYRGEWVCLKMGEPPQIITADEIYYKPSNKKF